MASFREPGGVDISDLAKSISIFQDLSEDDFNKLVKITVPISFPAGTVIFRQGDASDAFYIIQKGDVRIVQNAAPDGSGGRELATLKDGEIFGEMGVLEDTPRIATAVVANELQVLRVKRSDFDNLMSLNPGIAMKIMVTVSRRFKTEPQAIAPIQPVTSPGRSRPEGKVIAINSMTGGSGVSTVVCNLGYELQKVSGGKVILVDGSVQFGDLPVFLDVIPKLTLSQLAEETDITMEMLGKGYINKTSFNVDFVAAPMKPELADVVTSDLLRYLINLLKTQYDFVVIDTYSLMQEPILTMLELADLILYVMTPDIPAMKNCRLWVELVTKLEFPEDKLRIIVNKYDTRNVALDLKVLEEKLASKPFQVLPYEGNAVTDCINKGVLLNVARAKDPLAEKISELALKIARPGAETPAHAETGGVTSWFKKRFGF